jgi:hypothetical protein
VVKKTGAKLQARVVQPGIVAQWAARIEGLEKDVARVGLVGQKKSWGIIRRLGLACMHANAPVTPQLHACSSMCTFTLLEAAYQTFACMGARRQALQYGCCTAG